MDKSPLLEEIEQLPVRFGSQIQRHVPIIRRTSPPTANESIEVETQLESSTERPPSNSQLFSQEQSPVVVPNTASDNTVTADDNIDRLLVPFAFSQLERSMWSNSSEQGELNDAFLMDEAEDVSNQSDASQSDDNTHANLDADYWQRRCLVAEQKMQQLKSEKDQIILEVLNRVRQERKEELVKEREAMKAELLKEILATISNQPSSSGYLLVYCIHIVVLIL